ncbi:MAG: hypothetical protein WCH39_19040 [Schlesneria sp.]
MARLARVEVFSPDEIAIVHVMNRVVRRCFLLGNDPVTGRNYDHRKIWIEEQLHRLAACFGIDLLCFAILSNHFHLILRSRPDVVATWDDTEVARRWLMLCPVRKNDEGFAEEPNEAELNMIRNDPQRLQTVRLRLSDIAWWMRLLCQNIAVRANHEDREMGKFWQSRYRAVRLLDEQAILACAAYVDLNPIRAAMAETLEESDFTSVQRRIQALPQEAGKTKSQSVDDAATEIDDAVFVTPESATGASPVVSEQLVADRFLAPLTIDERHDRIGPDASSDGFRCSNKGFLSIPVADYLILLDWTARQLADRKPGSTPHDAPPIFTRLSIDPDVWCNLVGGFGRLFWNVAGRPQTIDATRSRIGQHRYHIPKQTRDLLPAG